MNPIIEAMVDIIGGERAEYDREELADECARALWAAILATDVEPHSFTQRAEDGFNVCYHIEKDGPLIFRQLIDAAHEQTDA